MVSDIKLRKYKNFLIYIIENMVYFKKLNYNFIDEDVLVNKILNKNYIMDNKISINQLVYIIIQMAPIEIITIFNKYPDIHRFIENKTIIRAIANDINIVYHINKKYQQISDNDCENYYLKLFLENSTQMNILLDNNWRVHKFLSNKKIINYINSKRNIFLYSLLIGCRMNSTHLSKLNGHSGRLKKEIWEYYCIPKKIQNKYK